MAVSNGYSHLQAAGPQQKNVKIEMDEFNPPAFKRFPVTTPWYMNTDSVVLNNSRSRATEEKALSNYKGEGNMLKEAVIKAKKIVPGSRNLNGPGEADQVIGEEELVKADKMTLEELLVKKVKGFFVFGPGVYSINRKEVRLIFDGYNIDYFYNGESIADRAFFMNTYMNYFTAEDIIGIEVMDNLKYSANYNVEFLNSGGIKAMRARPAPDAKIAYLEITTRSKKGPFMQVTPGTYLFKTLPFTLAKQFYSPKYTVKSKATAVGTDLRSTIFWDANVVTDKDGLATVSFYSADKAADYSVILEGTNMNGQLGYKKYKISVSR
jgi:hypothetical protein